ncbi:alpha/beta hydrolase [Actinoallomurus purpureus]|uniref:alpha/beta fold hydrolase n=1 Tax=Actinoallomurus purpureus TaxID=478114 RepID=UPI002093C362|nr:alpha/beta fold hydrolase [Actinoallomurus purpureus]MCO6008316.1 alpha/beta hydrolase [Actinoallomurus purpureus]
MGVPIIGAAALVTLPATAAVARPHYRATGITWQTCPRYDLDALRVRDDQIPRFRSLMARMECGTLRVPLSYDQPTGRKISIAVTRLRATDPAHRLGSLAVNPGGPGASGYLMPVKLITRSPTNMRLNARYDMIGFDPRGVGRSSKVDCPELRDAVTPPHGPLTERAARQAYARQVAANQACAKHDPAFLSQLTTADVARDLDQIRAALGETTISYLGTSWGTALGAHYRSLFPHNVARMWLDSVMGPDFRLDAYADTTAQVTEQNFSRQAAWIAKRNARYGLGTTPEAVKAAVLRLERAYDADPKRNAHAFVDGGVIAGLASQASGHWELAAEALKALTDEPGPVASPVVEMIFRTLNPPLGASEADANAMYRATVCNEEAGRRDFASAWTAYRRRLARYPVTSRNADFVPTCAGWPLPVRPWRLTAGGGSLELSAHQYETTTPYGWAKQMQAVIGGTVLTVDDDVHASAVSVPECAAHIVAYFDTGRPDAGQCHGAAPDGAGHAAQT